MPLFPLFLADDDGLTQRERRRQQHEKTKPSIEISKGVKKNLIGGGIVVAVLAIILIGMASNQAAAAECPGHWHSTYTVFIDGDRVQYPPTPANGWEDAGNPDAAGTHIHGNDGVYHFHPAVSRCTPMNDALAHLDTVINDDGIVLGPEHGIRAGAYSVNETHELRVFTREPHGEWEEEDDLDFLDKQPKNGVGMAFIYGNHTEAEIEALLAQATVIDGTNYDPTR